MKKAIVGLLLLVGCQHAQPPVTSSIETPVIFSHSVRAQHNLSSAKEVILLTVEHTSDVVPPTHAEITFTLYWPREEE